MFRVIPYRDFTHVLQTVYDAYKADPRFGWVYDHDDEWQGSEGHCVYRGPEGQKCSMGQLIPDALYMPAWDDGDGMPIDDLLGTRRGANFEGRRSVAVVQLFANCDPNDVSTLQAMHDEMADTYKDDASDAGMQKFLGLVLSVIHGEQSIQDAHASR